MQFSPTFPEEIGKSFIGLYYFYDPDEEHFCKFILKQHIMSELVFELFDLIVALFFEFVWNAFGITERTYPISDSDNLSIWWALLEWL